VRLIPAACAGFLLAVLWMDLIFDSQVLRHRGADVLPESVLDSISGYYHRATTTSRPMSYLIALVMVILLAALGFRGLRGTDPGWLLVVSVVLAGVPILLALVRTVPNAVMLGNRVGTAAEQSRLARSILGDHLACLAGMTSFLVLWLTVGAAGTP
jgi:hypothetical protein